MVLADEIFTAALKSLAARDDTKSLFGVTAEQHQTQRDLEYLVRTVVHTFVEYSTKMDIEEYLSGGILTVIENNLQIESLSTLNWVIQTLMGLGGNETLLPPAGSDFVSGARRFTLRALEVIVVGLASNKTKLQSFPNAQDFIRSKISGFWAQPIAAELSSAGMRGTTRIQRSVPFGKAWFNPDDSTT